MRAFIRGIVFAASLCGIAALALPVAPAQAEEYCGFMDQMGFRVHCGYSSAEECEQSLGGNAAICMPDPNFAGIARPRSAATVRNS
jgi:hypothetical protein